MKNDLFKKGILFLCVLVMALTFGLVGCASSPHERPDGGKIKQNSEKAMQDLEREEIRHGNTDDY